MNAESPHHFFVAGIVLCALDAGVAWTVMGVVLLLTFLVCETRLFLAGRAEKRHRAVDVHLVISGDASRLEAALRDGLAAAKRLGVTPPVEDTP